MKYASEGEMSAGLEKSARFDELRDLVTDLKLRDLVARVKDDHSGEISVELEKLSKSDDWKLLK